MCKNLQYLKNMSKPIEKWSKLLYNIEYTLSGGGKESG
jgi:hypothetical protein